MLANKKTELRVTPSVTPPPSAPGLRLISQSSDDGSMSRMLNKLSSVDHHHPRLRPRVTKLQRLLRSSFTHTAARPCTPAVCYSNCAGGALQCRGHKHHNEDAAGRNRQTAWTLVNDSHTAVCSVGQQVTLLLLLLSRSLSAHTKHRDRC